MEQTEINYSRPEKKNQKEEKAEVAPLLFGGDILDCRTVHLAARMT